MSFKIFTDYPPWFWLLCMLCGAVYAFALYYREKKINSAIQQKWLRSILNGLRFLAVFLLAFLLLNPYLKSKFNQQEKPIIIIAQDNSSSLLQGISDTASYNQSVKKLANDLSDKYDVRTYTFGEKLNEGLTVNYADKSTDISSALNEIQSIYQNLNVGAIVVGSDGIYNTGSNPVYVKNNLNAPVYTVALGDTIPKKDMRITRVQYNDIVYLKDKFSVVCDIEGIFCKGAVANISITEITKGNTKIAGEKNIPVTSDQFNTSAEFILNADAPGIRHYRVTINKIEGEITTDNNVQDIYVDVLDARQKILILANAPHPDIAALKQSIETNQNYEVTAALVNDMRQNIADYNLIILHNLPSAQNQVKNILNEAAEKNIPLWFIAGTQTAVSILNSAQNLVKITGGGQSANEVTAYAGLNFNLFTLEQNTIGTFPKLPPLAAPYGTYSVSAASQIIFYQKIGPVNTKSPLLVYSLPGAAKIAVLCGENIWKWRLYNYLLNKNQDAVNELISKTVQYLSAKNDKKQFRATVAKNVFNENENVLLDAELYNDSYELVNDADATITITNEEGKEFPFQFNKEGKRYTLNAGFFTEGNYTFAAKVNYNNKEYKDNGAFSISPVRLETISTTANHQILNRLAVESNGEMIYPGQITSLQNIINQSNKAKPVLHETIKTQSVINLRWLFFVLLSLLAMEWFIRKYNGSY